MPEMCVIYSSNTTRNAKEGIYIHPIPYLDEKKEIMAEFVRGTRANWKSAGRSLRSVFIEGFTYCYGNFQEKDSCKSIAKKR